MSREISHKQLELKKQIENLEKLNELYPDAEFKDRGYAGTKEYGPVWVSDSLKPEDCTNIDIWHTIVNGFVCIMCQNYRQLPGGLKIYCSFIASLPATIDALRLFQPDAFKQLMTLAHSHQKIS